MKISSRLSPFKVCPKTGRIVGAKGPRQLPVILLPAVGFLALVWFLIRVVPKPSRAAYPCQRVAAPLAGSFLVWLAGIAGAGLAFRQARARLRQARYAAAGLALVVAVAGIAWAVLSLRQPAQAAPVAYTPHPANQPIGVGQGADAGPGGLGPRSPVTDLERHGDRRRPALVRPDQPGRSHRHDAVGADGLCRHDDDRPPRGMPSSGISTAARPTSRARRSSSRST